MTHRGPPAPRRPRHGLALPAAVFALAVIVLFIAGTAFTTTQEARASVGTLMQRLALEAAEYGAAAVLRDWDASWNVGMPIGRTIALSHSLPGGASSAVRVTRTSSTTWWVVSDGTAGSALARRGARRAVTAAVRLDLPLDEIDAALAATDSVRVTGTGLIVGTDSVESVTACGLVGAGVAGVASPDTTRTCDGACGASAGGISGNPRLLLDSTIAGRIAAIRASLSADIVLPAGSVVTPGPLLAGGACDTLAVLNWGDPSGGVCRNHLPVVRALGDLTMRGGTGQGVILAAGDVILEGGALFAGLVVADDDLVTGAGGATVLGAVVAGDARRGTGDHSVVGAGGIVRRSSCRLTRARLASAPPVRVRERWWVEFD